jgi:hypothetical protein
MRQPEYIRGTAWPITVTPEDQGSVLDLALYTFTAGLAWPSGEGNIINGLSEGNGIERLQTGLLITFTAPQTQKVVAEGTYMLVLKATPIGTGLVLEAELPIRVKFSRLS